MPPPVYPVSYTHLDVYKRQPERGRERENVLRGNEKTIRQNSIQALEMRKLFDKIQYKHYEYQCLAIRNIFCI